MRTLIVSTAIALIAMLTIPSPADAQSFRGYDRGFGNFSGSDERGDGRGAERSPPPEPVPDVRTPPRQTDDINRGLYPSCSGATRIGDRCLLPNGQVCTVYGPGRCL